MRYFKNLESKKTIISDNLKDIANEFKAMAEAVEKGDNKAFKVGGLNTIALVNFDEALTKNQDRIKALKQLIFIEDEPIDANGFFVVNNLNLNKNCIKED